MAQIKTKDLKNMSEAERQKRIEELKLELVKSKVNASKTGGSKIKEIKKMIARLITLKNK